MSSPALDVGAPNRPVIDRACPCAACGYDLQSVRVDGRCSECGAAVRETLVAHAGRLAGVDARSLRAVTSGIVWLVLAMAVPAVFAFVRLPDEGTAGGWWSGDRQRLAIVLTPAVFAVAACWRFGTRLGPFGVSDDDQPVTRWALRLTAVAWLAPLFIVAGWWHRAGPYRVAPLLSLVPLLTWTGVVATLLLFRRLKHVAGRIPAPVLRWQCAVVGSQLPLTTITLHWVMFREFQSAPDALRYATISPMPGAGIPWPIVVNARDFPWSSWNWELLISNPEAFLTMVMVLPTVCILPVAVQYLVVLLWVRRSDRELPGYCRGLLAAGAE
jgi:hypothetical protein